MYLAIQVRLQTRLFSAIEDFRRSEPDIPTRPEAVRRLLQRALNLGDRPNVGRARDPLRPTFIDRTSPATSPAS
jgi:hypothetical protein